MKLRVAALFVYPVKSAAGVALDAAEAGPAGLRHDRRWMIVDADGTFVTQREMPALARIAVAVEAGGLRLDAPGAGTLRVVEEPRAAARRQVQVWGDVCAAVDAGPEAARWLSAFAGRPLALVHLPDDALRTVDERYATGHRVGFADAYPYLLLGEASIADLAARGGAPDPRRFRPNLVIAGAPPFAEDGWRVIETGGLRLELVKPCARCAIPDVDPERGVRDPGTLAALARYRTLEHRVLFGQNAVAAATGTVRVGDEVRVLELQASALG
ncbi:MAG: MOSC N-terminal beta barrel domain-containing protein [Polyangiaceae bacterium]